MLDLTDLERQSAPLFDIPDGRTPAKARELTLEPCDTSHARILNRRWHSRLPETTNIGWMYTFAGKAYGVTYGVALWSNPTSRTLPSQWLELRRLAVSPDAPKYTATRMLGLMRRWFLKHHPEHEKLISYQDTDVHEGTIYKAANWTLAYTGTRGASKTDRSSIHIPRNPINGSEVDASPKARWEIPLKPTKQNENHSRNTTAKQ